MEAPSLASTSNDSWPEPRRPTAVLVLENRDKESVWLNAALGSDADTHNSSQFTSVDPTSAPHREPISSASNLQSGGNVA